MARGGPFRGLHNIGRDRLLMISGDTFDIQILIVLCRIEAELFCEYHVCIDLSTWFSFPLTGCDLVMAGQRNGRHHELGLVD